jgi:hypothetical protein
MHYSAYAFSKNNNPTIEAKQNSNTKMGQRDGFSKSDIEKVNKMYKCTGTTGTPSTTTAKPNQSVLGNLIEALFPSSNKDEEEMIE